MKHYTSIPFHQIDITGGFWQKRQQINRDTTIWAVYDRFADTGRIAAFDFDWKEGMPNRPHIFWDSDVAKWMESAAYLLHKAPDARLEEMMESLIEKIIAHQEPNGYFNIYFTVIEPDARFTRRNDHELYCAGHLMEAAVAYYYATGRDAFLKAMCRYADHIEQVFKVEKTAGFCSPGHEEIELALVKLYKATGEQRYLELSRHFVDVRGVSPMEESANRMDDIYSQHHMAVREQTTAEGHSVRAVYLYSGMADLADLYEDEALHKACNALFDNIVNSRMYVTGGIGSSAHGEMFTQDYDLPNKRAYAESCAAIGLAFFARRMMTLGLDSRYADTVERVLYNGFLSSVSLDGRSFFYENALEIDTQAIARVNKLHQEHLPPAQRSEVFGCSCCPPNITRFVSAIGDYLYTTDENTVYVHQFMESEARITLNGREITLTQKTEYPYRGRIVLSADTDIRVALRIPGWCRNWKLSVDGKQQTPALEGGYAPVDLPAGKEAVLELSMPLVRLAADPRVSNDNGRCALARGPMIFCLEGVDNGENLRGLTVEFSSLRVARDEDLGVMTVVGEGFRRLPGNSLYAPIDEWEKQRVPVKFIPYYAFANRGVTDMLVFAHIC